MKKRTASVKKSMPKIPKAFQHIEDAHGVSAYILKKNGLQVLIMPKRELPVVGTMVTYHVGSRHETAGHTGATHILEHLMFKGSKKYDPKKGNGIWSLLEKKGCQGNATTWCDRTNYYWVSPVHLFKDALSIEADRMRNILLRPADLTSEMTVVRNEYESGENEPQHRLSKQAWYQAFTLHPYRIPTIGTKEDIEGVSVEKLRKFYDTFYWPNNATVTIVGDVTIPEALSVVEKSFGKIPQREIIEPPFLHEPPQTGERRFTLKRAGTVRALLMSFKAPAGLAPDAYAVSLLGAIVGEGKSSLLYRALVDTGFAIDVHVEYPRFKDPSLFEIYVSLAENVPHAKAEHEIMSVLEKIKVDGPETEDTERALQYVEATYLYATSSVSGVLSAINESIARGNWKDALVFPKKLRAVEKTEIQKAARNYFSSDTVTIGHLHAV